MKNIIEFYNKEVGKLSVLRESDGQGAVRNAIGQIYQDVAEKLILSVDSSLVCKHNDNILSLYSGFYWISGYNNKFPSLPILSTKVGGVPEMIINGETGILVSHDDQAEFVNALIELINMDDSQRMEIGKNAYNYAMENYSMELLAKKYADIYESQCRRLQRFK